MMGLYTSKNLRNLNKKKNLCLEHVTKIVIIIISNRVSTYSILVRSADLKEYGYFFHELLAY